MVEMIIVMGVMICFYNDSIHILFCGFSFKGDICLIKSDVIPFCDLIDLILQIWKIRIGEKGRYD